MIIQKLRTANTGIKVFVVIIAGYAVSSLFDLFLPAHVSHGLGFFSVLILSYPIAQEYKKGFARWFIWSLFLGVLAYFVTFFFTL